MDDSVVTVQWEPEELPNPDWLGHQGRPEGFVVRINGKWFAEGLTEAEVPNMKKLALFAEQKRQIRSKFPLN